MEQQEARDAGDVSTARFQQEGARDMERVRQWVGPAMVALAFAVMLVWTWGRWLDPIIDFGRELYVPWQISEGKVLYRDIAAFYGPLSQYVNAGWFWLVGPGLMQLVGLNLAVLAGTLGMLYRVLVEIGASVAPAAAGAGPARDGGTRLPRSGMLNGAPTPLSMAPELPPARGGRFGATVGCVLFVVLCGFGHFIPVGNFTFVTPYCHEITHGFVLALGAVWATMRYVRNRSMVAAAVAGVCVGLSFLTKPEPFIAAAGAVGVGFLIFGFGFSIDRRRVVRDGLVMFAAGLLPVLAAFLFLRQWMPAREAWEGVMGSWHFMGRGEVTGQEFFLRSLGLDQPGANLRMMAWGVAWYLLALAPAVWVAWRMRRGGRKQYLAAAGIGVAILAAVGPFVGRIAWLQLARPLPLVVLAVLVVQGWLWWRQRDAQCRAAMLGRIVFTVFALLMMTKMVLCARVCHYGFVLSAGGLMVLILALMEWGPRALWVPDLASSVDDATAAARRAGVNWVLRAAGLAVLTVAVAGHVWLMADAMAIQDLTLGSGVDRFHTDGRADACGKLLDMIDRRIKPGQTFTVLPEGVMLNYLARRPTASRYLTFLPSDLAMFGEGPMLADLAEHRPDYLVIVQRTTSEFGATRFGRDYAVEFREWVEMAYEPAAVIGAVPFADVQGPDGKSGGEPKFGVMLLKRRAGTAKGG